MPNKCERTRIIAGNWKMNKTYSEAVALAQELSDVLKEQGSGECPVDVIVCPPLVDLKGVSSVIAFDKAPFTLGAQNVYWEKSGAFTGETSPEMLNDLDCDYCIIGHSERRGYFGETDADIQRKAEALIAADICPILCCGESLEIREKGEHVSFVVNQIKHDVANLSLSSARQLVIAYEPIWAIGTGKTATPADAQEVCSAIRGELACQFGSELASGIRVLYGGSAKPGNVSAFLSEQDVDGALVGGASLVAESFAQMVAAASSCN